jgi:enoyl-CoA hydratase/carnithine racemase
MTEVLRIESWDDVPRAIDAGAVLVVVDGTLPGKAAAALNRLAALDAPVVASLDGQGSAAVLALALASSFAVASESFAVDCSDPRDVLEVGLVGPLVAAVGTAPAKAILFGPQPVEAARLAACGVLTVHASPAEAAGEAAARLAANPATRLVVRSLRAAARSTRAQAAEYDAELLQLLGE